MGPMTKARVTLILVVLLMAPVMALAQSTAPVVDQDTTTKRVIRWTALMSSGFLDGYSTNAALRDNDTAKEGGLLAKHFIHGPGVSAFTYPLITKAIFAWLFDIGAKKHGLDATISATLAAAATLPAIIGNFGVAREGRRNRAVSASVIFQWGGK